MFPWHCLPTCKWPSPAGLPMSTSDWISLEFAIDSPQISRGSPNESGLRPRVAGRNEHQTLRERWIGCRTAADDDFWSCGFGKKGKGHQKRGAGTPQNIHAQISAMLISLHHVLSFTCYGLSKRMSFHVLPLAAAPSDFSAMTRPRRAPRKALPASAAAAIAEAAPYVGMESFDSSTTWILLKHFNLSSDLNISIIILLSILKNTQGKQG